MVEIKRNNIDHISAKKFEEIMDFLKLTPVGMAAFLDISVDHVYSLKKGRRSITKSVAKSLAKKLDISESDIFNTNYKFKKSKVNFSVLHKFRSDSKSSINYFSDLKDENSLTQIIRDKLLNEGFFEKEKTVKDVIFELKQIDIKVNSEKTTKSLKYLVELGSLNLTKKSIIKKNGAPGIRVINYYIMIEKL